ncbi:MAG: cobalamin-binding protein [Gemmataceae bacterium]
MPRIVSLIASATEIVSALGFEQDLVGRSHECDYPLSVHTLPVCTEPKFDVEGNSLEIDKRVKSLLADATSVYRVHTDVLQELRPDVLVTQAQCEVCAVSLKDVERAVCELLESQPKIVSLEPNALEDVWKDILSVATALGVDAKGVKLVNELQNRMQAIQNTTQSVSVRPTVACLEWLDPLMAAGNWIPELVEMAGGINLFGTAGVHSPWMKWEELVAKDPDVIVSLPCGFDLKRTESEMIPLTHHPEWNSLKAVREGRVFVTDGNQYFNRPGPRLVESLEILAELLHPQTFQFGHEGTGWKRFST